MGIRLPKATEQDIETAISGGIIIRTWAFRGTLHFLAAEDVSWILLLLAPVIMAGNKRRYRELDLDEKTFSKSNLLIRSVLEKNQHPCTRTELRYLLEQSGISTEGQRAHYLLQRAALAGFICLGPQRGREATYLLLPMREDSSTAKDRNAALTTLAQRYFTSQGPATIQDFCWWSGLPATMGREALQNASSLQRVTTKDTELWVGTGQPSDITESTCLLPRFDEYLLGYKDRSAALDSTFGKKVNAGGGRLKPVITFRGKVVGVWKPIRRKDRILLAVEPFGNLSQNEHQALETAVQDYGRFWEKPVELLR